MLKLVKWIWKKSEQSAAQHIMDIILAYHKELIVSDESPEALKYQQALMHHSRRDAMNIVQMIDRKYFPTDKNKPAQIRIKTDV